MPRASFIRGASRSRKGGRVPGPRGTGPCVCAASPSARLLHPQRASRLAGEELPDELVVRVEKLLRGPGLDDPALPEYCDVLRHAAGGHDVVGDHDVRAAVLLVDL